MIFLNIISDNINLILYIIWALVFALTIFILKNTNDHSTLFEKNAFLSFILLIGSFIAISFYTIGFGFNWLFYQINKFGSKNFIITLISILAFGLFLMVIKLKIKYINLSNEVKNIDQRYSINKNHDEYQKRKNAHRVYRSE